MRKLALMFSLVFLAFMMIGCGDNGTARPQPTPSPTPTATATPTPTPTATPTPTPQSSAVLFIRKPEQQTTVAAAKQAQGAKRSLRAMRHHQLATGRPVTNVLSPLYPGTDSVIQIVNDGTGEATILNQAGSFETVNISYDGSKAVFSAVANAEIESQRYMQIFTLDLTTEGAQPVQITTDAEHHYDPQFSRDASLVVFTTYSGEISRMSLVSAEGGAETLIPTDATIDAWGPTFTPDDRIVFADSQCGSINIINQDGTGMTALRNSACDADYQEYLPSVSPDGTTVAFTHWDDTSHENIWIVNIDGQNVNPVTTTGNSWDAQFANDRLVFVSYRDGNSEIYSINPDGTDEQRLTENTVEDYFIWD